jgi:cytochrome P450
VHLSTYYRAFFGDFYPFIENVKNGKVFYDHLRTDAAEHNKFDMRVVFEGDEPVVKVISAKARQEFQDNIPDKIDRSPETKSVWKIFLESAINKRSHPAMPRIRVFLEELSMNQSSKYIPHMLQCIQNIMGKWKKGENYGAIHEMNMFTFTAFSTVLFGQDMEHVAYKIIPYDHTDGTTEELPMREFFLAMVRDMATAWMHPLTALLPFLNIYNLINPFKRNQRNLERFKEYLNEAIENTNDEKSIWKRVLKRSTIDKGALLEDFVGLITGGAETISHTLAVVLYYLKKRPDVEKKIMLELDSRGFKKFADCADMYSLDNINEWEYLTFVIKECMRIDGPAWETLRYEAYQDVTIWGVKIPKSTSVKMDMISIHYDDSQWQSPHEFIPERFNPESKYFSIPGAEKARAPYTFYPFSYGKRGCPGQAFSMLEIKVTLIYILTHWEFSVQEDFLNKEGIGFGLGTNTEMIFKVEEIKHFLSKS